MNDPLVTLGLSPDSGDEAIRSRYLELVRAYPPERAPQRFAEIRAAYEALRDPVQRIQRQLFDLDAEGGIDDVIATVRRSGPRRRFPTDLLLSLGRK